MSRCKIDNLQEIVETVTPPVPNLRRSCRKRKPNKHADFDYDNEAENDFKTPKITPKKYSGFSRKSLSLLPSPMPYSSPEAVPESPEEQEYMEVEAPSPSSSKKVVRKSNTSRAKSNANNANDSLSKPDKLNPTLFFPRSELVRMNPMQIIEMHAENLERRLENVAYKYLAIWTPPPPSFVPPYPFVVGDTNRYQTTVPDDIAVLRVVRDLINSVSASSK